MLEWKEAERLANILDDMAQSNRLIFPYSLAVKCKISRRKVSDSLSYLWVQKLLNAYTFAEYSGKILPDSEIIGIRPKEAFKNIPPITDDDDEPIPYSDLKAVIGYKAVNE